MFILVTILPKWGLPVCAFFEHVQKISPLRGGQLSILTRLVYRHLRVSIGYSFKLALILAINNQVQYRYVLVTVLPKWISPIFPNILKTLQTLISISDSPGIDPYRDWYQRRSPGTKVINRNFFLSICTCNSTSKVSASCLSHHFDFTQDTSPFQSRQSRHLPRSGYQRGPLRTNFHCRHQPLSFLSMDSCNSASKVDSLSFPSF